MKILKFVPVFILLFVFTCFFSIKIQAQTFGAAVEGSLIVSQIDGDQSAGFNKPGPSIGLFGIAKLKEKLDLKIGISYDFRGSQSEFFPDNSYPQLKINLQYVDVPLTIHYKDWLEKEGGFYHMDFYAGAYFGRLLSASAQYSGYDDITNSFNKNEIGIILGGGYNFNGHNGIGVKWCRGVNHLFESGTGGANQNSLINRFIHFYYQYKF